MGRGSKSMPTEKWLELEMAELSFQNLLLTNIIRNTSQKHIAETQPHYGGTTNWDHIAAEFDPKKTCLLMDAAKETIILNTWEPPT